MCSSDLIESNGTIIHDRFQLRQLNEQTELVEWVPTITNIYLITSSVRVCHKGGAD